MTKYIKERNPFTRCELVAYFDKQINDMKEAKGYDWHDKNFFIKQYEKEKEEKLKDFDAGKNIAVYEERYFEYYGNDRAEVVETIYADGKVKTSIYGCN